MSLITRPRIGLVEDGGDAGVLEFNEQENQLRLQYWTDYGNAWGRNMMILDGDTGHVGIGTTNPYQKLHIMDGGIAFTDSVNPIDERLLYLGITGIGPDGRGYKFSWRNDDGSLRSDAMILDRTGDVYFMGGNVGIGTPSPLYDLHVNDSADAYVKAESASGEAFFVADGSSNSGLKIQENGTAKADLFWNTANESLGLAEGGVERLSVKGGNVGIGTTNPSEKLDVDGNIDVSSNQIKNYYGFPRPNYDSGWITLAEGEFIDLNHNIGGNIDNYVMDLTFKFYEETHNIGIGRDWGYSGGVVMRGSYWRNLTSTSIRVYRETDDFMAQKIRLRIWVYN